MTNGSQATLAPTNADRPPGLTRWFVRIFLASFVACAVFGIELFPLTGFRLFSHLRHEQRATWIADTVGANGGETQLWFTDLPRAYQGFSLVMPRFEGLSPSAKAATCRAWLLEARHVRAQVVAIRFYRITWPLLPRAGDRPARHVSRALGYACR